MVLSHIFMENSDSRESPSLVISEISTGELLVNSSTVLIFKSDKGHESAGSGGVSHTAGALEVSVQVLAELDFDSEEAVRKAPTTESIKPMRVQTRSRLLGLSVPARRVRRGAALNMCKTSDVY
jgi:hypothetical protein